LRFRVTLGGGLFQAITAERIPGLHGAFNNWRRATRQTDCKQQKRKNGEFFQRIFPCGRSFDHKIK
jgi:hypothetical protein